MILHQLGDVGLPARLLGGNRPSDLRKRHLLRVAIATGGGERLPEVEVDIVGLEVGLVVGSSTVVRAGDEPLPQAQRHGQQPRVGNHRRLAGEDRLPLPRLTLVRYQNVPQTIGRGIDALGVDHEAREIIVEHLRFDPGGRPGPRDLVERALEGAGSPRPSVERQRAGEEHRDHHEDRDGGDQLVEAQARAAKSNHLGVGGEPAEGNQNGEEHRHGKRHLQEGGEDVGEETQHADERHAPVDDELDQLDQPCDEEDEREEREPKRERDKDFTEDVAMDDPHHPGRHV